MGATTTSKGQRDMTMIDSAPRLTIELVPQTCWFSNVRDQVSGEDWDRIRRQIYKRSGQCCEVCGGRGSRHPIRSDLVARRVGSRGLRSRPEGHRRGERDIGRGPIVDGIRSHRRGPELRGAGHTAERDRLIHRSSDAWVSGGEGISIWGQTSMFYAILSICQERRSTSWPTLLPISTAS